LPTSRFVAGVLAGLASAAIGGAWQVATRHATTTSIAPADLAMLRYGIPALVLLPILWRIGFRPPRLRRTSLAVMLLGAGLPFGLVAMTGTVFAPSAHMGVLMAGASPLFAAAFAWALWNERPLRTRAAGLVCMALGVGLLGADAAWGGTPGTWKGDLMFLLAAALWATFTLAFRRSGLTPWEGAALVNAWSAALLLPWMLWHGPTSLFEAPVADVLFQTLWQGVLAGLLGLWAFGVAIVRLGAAPAAALGALVPAVSALGGWWWLDEALTTIDLLAISGAVVGVALASGAMPLVTPAADSTLASKTNIN